MKNILYTFVLIFLFSCSEEKSGNGKGLLERAFDRQNTGQNYKEELEKKYVTDSLFNLNARKILREKYIHICDSLNCEIFFTLQRPDRMEIFYVNTLKRFSAVNCFDLVKCFTVAELNKVDSNFHNLTIHKIPFENYSMRTLSYKGITSNESANFNIPRKGIR